MLAEIPFVRLRGGIPQHLLEGKTSFSESIKFARLIEDIPKLRIDVKNGSLWVKDIEIELTPINFIFYLWILELSLRGEYVIRPDKNEKNRKYAEEIQRISIKYGWEMKLGSSADISFKLGITGKWLSDRIDGVNNKALEQALGKHGSNPYAVQKFGGYGNTKYHITLTEDQLLFA